MSTPMIAMDPKRKDDQFYRYKMPAIVTKVEGNGNGIKTVFPNIHEVCGAINRPEAIMMKFFQYELGSQQVVQSKDDKFIIQGSRTQEVMQEKVYAFIQKFVLCRHCRNPETQVSVDAKDRVSMKCSACGKVTDVASAEKCTPLFAQHYKNLKETSKRATATEAPKQQTTADVAGDAAGAAVSAAKPAETINAVDDRPNPAVILAKALTSDPNDVEGHIRLVYELRTQYNLKETRAAKLVLLSIVEVNPEKFMSCLQQHSKLLARFALVKESSADQGNDAAIAEAKKREMAIQETIISECEQYTMGVNAIYKFPILLKMLFEEGVIKQQSIEAWKPSKKTPPALAEEAVRLMKPLLDWLI